MPFTSSKKTLNLYRAVRERKWDTAIYILQSLPPHNRNSHINNTGKLGWNRNALHWSCYHRDCPIEIIELILTAANATEDVALVQDDDGCTPLHIAIDRRGKISDDLNLKLIRACPRAASVLKKGGYSALHWALKKDRSKDVIEALIEADSSKLLEKNCKGITPLEKFFATWNNQMLVLIENLRTMMPSASPFSPLLLSDLFISNSRGSERKLTEVLDKTALLLEHSIRIKNNSGRATTPFFPFHASLKITNCPWSFCHFLLRSRPDQALQFDDEGNLPLHIICSTQTSPSSDSELYRCRLCKTNLRNRTRYILKLAKNRLKCFCDDCSCPYRRDKESWVTLNPVNKSPAIIHDILFLLPQTANIPNRMGRLPLHIAIESRQLSYFHHGDTSVTFQLYKASPQSLRTRDITNHMAPFMMSAIIQDNECLLEQFSEIFNMLCEDPNLVAWGIPNMWLQRSK